MDRCRMFIGESDDRGCSESSRLLELEQPATRIRSAALVVPLRIERRAVNLDALVGRRRIGLVDDRLLWLPDEAGLGPSLKPDARSIRWNCEHTPPAGTRAAVIHRGHRATALLVGHLDVRYVTTALSHGKLSRLRDDVRDLRILVLHLRAE